MRGVCLLFMGDYDGAYYELAAALEVATLQLNLLFQRLRDHEFIDYTQLKLEYKLVKYIITSNFHSNLLDPKFCTIFATPWFKEIEMQQFFSNQQKIVLYITANKRNISYQVFNNYQLVR
jgi:hypothetical protein